MSVHYHRSEFMAERCPDRGTELCGGHNPQFCKLCRPFNFQKYAYEEGPIYVR